MTSVAQLIKQLIDKQISKIATIDVGMISAITSYDRVSVKLKHTVAGRVIEYTDVPILPAGAGGVRVYAYPRRGDTVIIAFLMYDPSPQLEQVAATPPVNELAKWMYPVVIAAIDADDAPPSVQPTEGEAIICQSESSYIKFTSTGNIEIVAPVVTVNGTRIPQEE